MHNTTLLLKSVCAVHLSALAFKDVCKTVPEVRLVIDEMSSLASVFHMSARRTTDLQKTAATNNLDVHRFPQSFEVRWAEFSARLLETVLGSWRALMAYADSGAGNDFSKFHKYLTCRDNIKLICFLADLLFILTNLQKKLQ